MGQKRSGSRKRQLWWDGKRLNFFGRLLSRMFEYHWEILQWFSLLWWHLIVVTSKRQCQICLRENVYSVAVTYTRTVLELFLCFGNKRKRNVWCVRCVLGWVVLAFLLHNSTFILNLSGCVAVGCGLWLRFSIVWSTGIYCRYNVVRCFWRWFDGWSSNCVVYNRRSTTTL